MMFPELENFLDTGSSRCKTNILFVRENGTEEYFVTCHYLIKTLKSDGAVCLVSLKQLSTHYIVIAEKYNLNLKTYMENGKFRFVDGLEWLGTSFIDNLNVLSPMKELYLRIKKSLDELLSVSNLTIVVDDLSVLTEVGYSIAETMTLVQHLRKLVNSSGMMIVVVNCGDMDKPMKNKLATNMNIIADVIMTLEPLRTGYCREISGQVGVTWKNQLEKPSEKPLKKIAHYKLTEKSLSIIPIGLSAAVL